MYHIPLLRDIQKLRIPKIQFIDYMKLKKKEDQSVDALVLLRRGIKYPWLTDNLWTYTIMSPMEELKKEPKVPKRFAAP